MRTAIALALALAATAANAQPLQLVPPPEYDHPYVGKINMVIARDQAHVRELCPRAAFSDYIGALACSMRNTTDSCTIVISPKAVVARGIPMDVVFRHEVAHCNGWPADHKGALFYDEWAEAPKTPKQLPTMEEWARGNPRHCGIAIQKPCDPLDVLLFGH